jgi:hypothetical protein
LSAQEQPGFKQYLVTIPGDATAGADIQVLVREWESGQIEADVRASTDHADPWCPVELVGGSVERA